MQIKDRIEDVVKLRIQIPTLQQTPAGDSLSGRAWETGNHLSFRFREGVISNIMSEMEKIR